MRSEQEIEDLIARAIDSKADLHGVTYQDGIRDALGWVLEQTDDPLEGEE